MSRFCAKKGGGKKTPPHVMSPESGREVAGRELLDKKGKVCDSYPKIPEDPTCIS